MEGTSQDYFTTDVPFNGAGHDGTECHVTEFLAFQIEFFCQCVDRGNQHFLIGGSAVFAEGSDKRCSESSNDSNPLCVVQHDRNVGGNMQGRYQNFADRPFENEKAGPIKFGFISLV